jgi:DNA-directed RNA polymerase
MLKQGNVLINLMIDLNLIKHVIKDLAKDEKLDVFNTVISENKGINIQILPKNLPMIIPPKLYKWENGEYSELGGYLFNGINYTEEIVLSNWELSSKSKFLNENKIVDMVNKLNSIPFRINEKVFDFIILNNDKYKFYSPINEYHSFSLKKNLQLKKQENCRLLTVESF